MASRTYVFRLTPSLEKTIDPRKQGRVTSQKVHEQHYAGNSVNGTVSVHRVRTYVHDDATESSDSDPAVPRIDFIRFNAMYTYRMEEYGYVA